MQETPRRPPGRPLGFKVNGPRLRQIRVEHGVTSLHLARRICRDYKTIWRAERGDRISEVTAWQIARALTRIGPEVKPQDFMAEWPDDETAEALAS